MSLEDELRALIELTLPVSEVDVIKLQSGVLHELYIGIKNPKADAVAEGLEVSVEEREKEERKKLELEKAVFGYFQALYKEQERQTPAAHISSFKSWPFALPHRWWQMDQFARRWLTPEILRRRWGKIVQKVKSQDRSDKGEHQLPAPSPQGGFNQTGQQDLSGMASPSTSSVHSDLGGGSEITKGFGNPSSVDGHGTIGSPSNEHQFDDLMGEPDAVTLDMESKFLNAPPE